MKTRPALLILLGLLVAVLAFIALGWFPQGPLRGYVERRIQQALGPGSRLGGLRVVPGRLSVEVRDVVIESPDYRLEIPRGRLVLTPGFVFRQDLAFRVAELYSPRLVIRPQGGERPARRPFSDPVRIEQLLLRDGTIVYDAAPPSPDVVQITGVDAEGSLGMGSLVLRTTGGRWEGRARPIPLGPANARLRVSPLLDVNVDHLEAGTRDSHFTASGTLGRAGDIQPDLTFKGVLALDDVERFAGPKPEMDGTVNVEGRVGHDGDALAVDARVQGARVRIQGWPIDRADARVKYVVAEPPRATVSADLAVLGGKADAEATLRAGAVDFHVRFAGIDAARLERQGIELGVPFEGRLSGDLRGEGDLDASLRVRGTVRADGRAQDNLAVNAKLDLDGSVRVETQVVDVRFTLDLDAVRKAAGGTPSLREAHVVAKGRAQGAMPPVVTAGYTGTVVLQTARGAESVPLAGDVRLQRGTVTADAHGRALGGTIDASLETQGSVARRLEVRAANLDVSGVRPGASGVANVTFRGSGPFSQLSGEGTINADELVWDEVRVGDATATVNAVAGRARVRFEAPELRASGGGTVGSRGFRGTLRLAQTPLAPLQPMLSRDRPLSGEVTATVDVGLLWSRPDDAVIRARVEQLDVQTGDTAVRARAPFSLTARGRDVTVEGVDIEGPGLAFQGSGRLGLSADAPLDLKGHLEMDLAKVPSPAGWRLAGLIKGDVQLLGTPSAPRATGLVTLSSVEFQRPGFPLVTVSEGLVEMQGDSAYIRELHGNFPGGRVDLLGRVPLAAILSEEQARRLGIPAGGGLAVEAAFDVDLSQWPVRSGWRMEGHIEGDLEFVGTRSRPRAFGLVSLVGVALDAPGDRVLAIPEGRAELTGDVVTTQGIEASVAGGTVRISGAVPLAAILAESSASAFQLAPGQADLRMAWSSVQAGTLLEALRDRPSSVSATLNGEARLFGRLSAREELQGELTLAATTARIQDVEIQSAPFRLTLDRGQVATDGLSLSGPGGTFVAKGSADLIRETVEATGQGHVELRALSPLLEEALVTGTAEVDLTVSGPLTNPQPRGVVSVRDGTLRMRDIRQPLTSIAARVVFENGQMRLEETSALLGGGTLQASGGARLDGLRLSDVRVQLAGAGMGLRYPVGGGKSGLFEDFKARVDAELTLTGRPGDFLLGGTVVLERGLYDADIFLEEGFLPPSIPPATERPSRFLRTVALNVSIATENPMLVRNNLAQIEAVGSLWLRGDMDEPAPFGRLEIRPNGKVFLQERDFTIMSGYLIYTGTTSPDISIRAETLIKNVEVARGEVVDVQVTLVAQGSLDRPGIELSSTPSLSQQEIASLIATGQRSVGLGGGAGVGLVGQQAAALLAGRFTREVARGLLDLGFDTVDIRPELIALEGDPGARFTFGKQVGPALRLVYSIGLNNPEAQYYQVEFRLGGQNLITRAQRLESGNWEYSVGQRLRFGGTRRMQSTEIQPTELAAVPIEGDLREFEAAIRGRIKAKPGKKVTYWDLLDDSDRIRELLVEEGYLESVVDARLDENTAVFHGLLGPRYQWRVEGMPGAPDLTKEVRQSLFEEEAVERGRQRLLDELRRQGHLRAEVETRIVPEGGYRTIVFIAKSGPTLRAEVTFPGAQVLSPKKLLEAAGGPAALLADPREARERIRASYREEQYLAAEAGEPKVVEQDGIVHITVPITEGPRAVVAAVHVPGATSPESELVSLAAIKLGKPYDPLAATDALRRLREHFFELGYPAVRITPSVVPVGHDLEIRFRVAEGPRVVVGPVVIKGLRRTRESLVRGQIDLEPGQPLDPRRLADLERRLRDLGVFSRAVVTASDDTPATITIELEEDARYGLAYDLRYQQGPGASALVDGEVRNLWGRGMVLSSRVRAGRNIREGRLAFHVPSIFLPRVGRIGDLTASIYRRDEVLTIAREIVGGQPNLPTFEDTRFEEGFTLHQTGHFLHPWDVLYGYNFRRANYSSVRFRPVEVHNVGSIDTTAILDTRDNPLNPHRGNFYSVSLEAGQDVLGSDFNFLKGYLQVSLTSYLTRTLMWAQGYRFGAMRAAGGVHLPDEVLFRAGGPNSLRGFSAESLATEDSINDAALGEALIIINQELRFMPLQGRFGIAAFYDTGNVFERVQDISFDFTHTLGVGLRYDSVVGLVRVDLAFPLNKPPGERPYRLLFGLGQAF